MLRKLGRVCKWKYLVRIALSLITCVALSCSKLKHFVRVKKNMSYQVQRRPEEVSPYQLPSRFLGEIHIVLSSLIIACSIGTIINCYYQMAKGEPPEVELLDMGFILFLSITLLVSFIDVVLSILLIFAAKRASLEMCLFWERFTISLLITFTLLTIGFVALLSTALVILGLLPSLIYKPFAIWVVNGFILDLKTQIIKSHPIALDQLSFSTGTSPDDQPKSTTVFIFNKDSPDIVESKILLTNASRANTNMKPLN